MKIFRKWLFVVTAGLVLVSLLVWYAGPYLAFADYHPLGPVWVRVAVILAVVLVFAGKQAWKQLKAARASTGLAVAVARQAAPAAGAADVEQLRLRFEEAVAHLRQGKRKVNLYELPWYAIIGAPGSGKTTALKNSGLHFPLEEKFGREAMRGVGGTRNCDWWFTDEAVLLDTAGRYTTQDSDLAADSAGWREFLSLLVKFRGRRPLNGIILTLSAADLLTQQPAERAQHVAALVRRLDELGRELKVRLPVYVLVTKSDLVAGFREYFDDQDHRGRSQVWGATFPLERSLAGMAAGDFSGEFSRLVARLNARVLDRVEQERDPRRKQSIFAFPQQWSTLGEPLGAYIDGVFGATRPGSQPPLLRGVYFTSGTQEGNPIDRILGALARTLPQEAAVSAPQGPGKAYFIEQLLKNVLFNEAGLAGVNRAAERRGMIVQLAGFAAAGLFAMLGIVALSVSYGRNKAYIAEVDAATQQFDSSAPSRSQHLLEGLPRLDALRTLAEASRRNGQSVPLSMRWGLYQGGNLGQQAQDAYLRELNDFLVPRVADAIRARLIAYTAEPDKLYEYLKAYLMLGQPEHLDVAQIDYLVSLEWRAAFPGQDNVQQRLESHFRALLDERRGLRAMPIDMEIVRQARVAIRQASVAKLVYSRLKLDYLGRDDAVVISQSMGPGFEKVLVRKSGRSMSEPVSALYTPAAFFAVTGSGSGELVRQFNDERWVLGDEVLAGTGSQQLENEVLDLYEDDYIAVWRDLLDDYTVVPFANVKELSGGLAILAGPTSPLRSLLQVVAENTRLVKPPGEDRENGITDRAQQAVRNRLDRLLPGAAQATGPATAPRGTKVTSYFADIHQLVGADGGQGRIERVLAQLNELQRSLQSVGTGVGEVNPLDALAQSGSGDAARTLRQEAATLPPVLAGLVTQVTGHSTAVAVGQARTELLNLYRSEVVGKCVEITQGKYPFVADSRVDVPPADFGRLFASSGIYSSFFQQYVRPFVDTTRRPWRWRSGEGGNLGLSDAILQQFQLAEQIRDTYFLPGDPMPRVRFRLVTEDYLDSGTRRARLEIDGRVAENFNGPENRLEMEWPGPKPGQAAITFEPRTGTARQSIVKDGPWAMFRLLDGAEIRRQSDVRYIVGWSSNGHEARMAIEATSVNNPFTDNLLRRFSCGG